VLQELQGSKDLKTSACTTCKPPSPQVRAYLKDVPREIVDRWVEGWGRVGVGMWRVACLADSLAGHLKALGLWVFL
jgi:hypothetical protein